MLCYCVIGGCCLTLMELSHGALAHCRITKSVHDELNTKSFTLCMARHGTAWHDTQRTHIHCSRCAWAYGCTKESKSSHKIRAMHSNYTWRSDGMSRANLPCERILMTWKASFVRYTTLHRWLAARALYEKCENVNMVRFIKIRNANEILKLPTVFAFISTFAERTQTSHCLFTVVAYAIRAAIQWTSLPVITIKIEFLEKKNNSANFTI